jgi:hypothetical protein
MPHVRWAAGFAGGCAIAVPAWWAALFQWPTLRAAFVPAAAWPDFQAVLLPDLLLSLACAGLAVQVLRGRPSAAALGLVCGGWTYATAYAITWAQAVSAPMIGPTLMVAALAGFGMVWYAVVPTRPTGSA